MTVRQPGTAGARIDVWGTTDNPHIPRGVPGSIDRQITDWVIGPRVKRSRADNGGGRVLPPGTWPGRRTGR